MRQKQLGSLFETACQGIMKKNNKKYDECSCGFEETEPMFPSNSMLGFAYVPRQEMDKVFTPCVGLQMGTLFPELVSPYSPNQSMEVERFLRIREAEVCRDGNY